MVRTKQTSQRKYGNSQSGRFSTPSRKSGFSQSAFDNFDAQSNALVFSQEAIIGSQALIQQRPDHVQIVPYEITREETSDPEPVFVVRRRAVIEEQSFRQIAAVKKRKHKPGVKALQEIRKLQRSTNLLIQRAPFARLAKDILQDMSARDDMRIQAEAISALQEASEAFLIQLFEAASLCSRHARRVTVMPADFQLVRNILTVFYSGSTPLT